MSPPMSYDGVHERKLQPGKSYQIQKIQNES